MKKVALYARVSTKQQCPQLQLEVLREYCDRRGFVIHDEYVDIGRSGTDQSRPELDRLMKDVLGRYFEAVVVWRFDRFARSLRHLVKALEEFNALDVDFISTNEAVDTSTPIGRAMFSVIGAMAQLERDLIKERVNAGLARAKRKGVTVGRPKRFVDLQAIRDLKKREWSNVRIAKKLKVSEATIRRRVEMIRQNPPEKTAPGIELESEV